MIEILKTSQDTTLDAAQNVVKRVRVVWRVDANHGPFVDYFPLDGFDGADVRRKLEIKATEINKLTGAS